MSSGMFNVGAYQMSGIPYVTGNVINPGQQHAYFFPNVTKRVLVQVYDFSGSGDNHVRVYFAPDNFPNNKVIANNHWWHVGRSNNISYIMDTDIRVKALYISHDTGSNVHYQIMAELTTISANDWNGSLTGSGIDS